MQKLRELIDQSESIILINLDSQRNVMLRLSVQLEMGMFSAALSGLIGVAFGMNLDSSLEEVCLTHSLKLLYTPPLTHTEYVRILDSDWSHAGAVWAGMEEAAALSREELG